MLLTYLVFCRKAELYRRSQARIDARAIDLYSTIKNNPAWYNDNSYFASAIISNTQYNGIYSAQIISYGDQNTAAGGREDKDWISYTMSADYDTYTMVDGSIMGITDNWATFVNTPPYYLIIKTTEYVEIKNSMGISVGLGNGLYTYTRRRYKMMGSILRLFYKYRMDLIPVMLEDVAFIPIPNYLDEASSAYLDCIIAKGECGDIYNKLHSGYSAFVASAKQQATQPTSPELWQLLGILDTGEDYIDIDTDGNIVGGQLTYWGIVVNYIPDTVSPVQIGVTMVPYYKNLKKLSSAKYLRHTRTSTLTTVYFISGSTIDSMVFTNDGRVPR